MRIYPIIRCLFGAIHIPDNLNIFDNSGLGFLSREIIHDEHGTPTDTRIVSVNDRYYEITGLTDTQLLGKKTSEVLKHIRNPKLRPVLYAALSGSGAPKTIEYFSPVTNRWYKVTTFRCSSGNINTLLDDIDAIKEAAKADLQQRINFEFILSTISSSFVNKTRLDLKMQNALRMLGEFLGVDRAYIFLLRNNGELMDNVYEWCSHGVEPQIEILQNIPTGLFPWWMEKLYRYEPVNIPKVSAMPAAAQSEREILEPQGIKSALALPLINEGKLIGFIGFDAVRHHVQWTDEYTYMLGVTGDVIAHTLMNTRIEQALTESEERFRIITDASGDVFYRIAFDTMEYDFIHPNVEQLTGYKPEEFSLRGIISVIEQNGVTVPDTTFIQNFAENIPDQYNADYLITTKSGKQKWISDRAYPWKNRFRKTIGIMGVLSDITERKCFELELLAAKEKAEEMNRLKTSFLANMSHELRTPLIGILGYAEIMQDTLTHTEDRENATGIYRTGRRLLNTLNLILELSHLESGNVQVQTEEFSLSSFITDMAERYRHLTEAKGLTMILQCEEGLTLNSDKNLLTVILESLLKNAILYTNIGSVSVGCGKNSEGIIIRVTDTGIGIRKEDQEKIFEEFRQVSEGLSRNYEGTGLGLTIARRYLEKIGGSISVESEPGRGSTFSILLPH